MMIVKIEIETGCPIGEPLEMPESWGSCGNPQLCHMIGHAEYIPPGHNAETHKLGKYLALGEAWTHTIVPLSTEELAQIAADKLILTAADKRNEIQSAYLAADEAIFSGYIQQQRQTFYKQEQESRAYLADNQASTPFLDGMVVNGYRTKEELVSRIIQKADALSLDYGEIIERYQMLMDLIDVAEQAGDQAALESIAW